MILTCGVRSMRVKSSGPRGRASGSLKAAAWRRAPLMESKRVQSCPDELGVDIGDFERRHDTGEGGEPTKWASRRMSTLRVPWNLPLSFETRAALSSSG